MDYTGRSHLGSTGRSQFGFPSQVTILILLPVQNLDSTGSSKFGFYELRSKFGLYRQVTIWIRQAGHNLD